MSQQEMWQSQTYCERIRRYAVQAVMAFWNNHKQPSTLYSIFLSVKSKIDDDVTMGQWPNNWKYPVGKRTIDRRVNEAADSKFYSDGVPKIVMVEKGVYKPNPVLFEKKEAT